MGVWTHVGSKVAPPASPTTNSQLTFLDEPASHSDASAACVVGFVAQGVGLKSAQDGYEIGQTEPKRMEEGPDTKLLHLFWAVPHNGHY